MLLARRLRPACPLFSFSVIIVMNLAAGIADRLVAEWGMKQKETEG